MASNEYEDLLGQDSALQPSNEYDSMIAEEKGVQKAQLQQNMYVAGQAQPDRRAEAMRLSEETKLPVSLVERNFDDIKKRRSVMSRDYESLINESPGLAKFLEDKNNATLAQDDIDNLKGVEQKVQDHSMLTTMYNSLGSGLATAASNIAKVPAAIYDAAALPQNLVNQAIGRDVRVKSTDTFFGPHNAVAEKYAKDAQAFQAQTPELNQSISTEIGKGNYARAGKVLAAQFVANAPQQALLITSMLSGYGTAGLVAAGATSAADKNAQNLDAGIDPVVGVPNAVATGAIESAFESLGTFGILKTWENAIAKEYGRAVSKEVMKDFGKTIAYSVAGEANEEAMTSFAQDFTDFASGVNPDALKGSLGRALDAGILGGVSGGVMTGPSAIASGVNQARQAQVDRDFYLSLGESVESSKLRERMPEAKQKYIEQLTKDTPVENVFIPAEAVEAYFQSKKINPVAVMQELGSLKSFEEAKERGGDVKIPLATWATKVVGTEHYQGLADDIRLSADGASVNEVKALKEQMAQEEQAKVQEVEDAAKLQRDQEASTAITESVKSQLGQIRERYQSMGSTLQLDDKQVDAYADVVARRYITRAESLGTTPQELFNKEQALYGMISGQDAQGVQRLEQSPKAPTAGDLGLGPQEQARIGQTFDQKTRDDYATLPGSMNGKLLDPDLARHLLPEYQQSREGRMLFTHATDSHSTKFVSRLYQNWLNETRGQPGMVLVLSGGSASGKTSLLKQFEGPLEKNADIILDTTSTNQEATKKIIDDALAAGKKVTFVHVHRDFDASVQANLSRFKDPVNGGRLVDPEYQAKTHVFSKETYLNLEQRYLKKQQEGLVTFQAFETKDGSKPVPLTVDNVRRKRYTKTHGTPEQAVNRLYSQVAKPALQGAVDEVLGAKQFILDRASQGEKSAARVFTQSNRRESGGLQESSDTLNQGGADGARGRILISPLQRIIELGPKADFSTLIHESGHAWLDEISKDYAHILSGDPATRTSQQSALVKDAETILNWLDAKSFDGLTVDQHEKWARGVEAYFMDGKAPTSKLRAAFARFKVWLINIYKNSRNLNVELSPEIADVMGRMITTENEIEQARLEQNVEPIFGDNPETFGLTGERAERYKRAVESAKEHAKSKLMAQFMEHFQRQREVFYKEQRLAQRQRIEADANSMPVYRALSLMQKGTLPDGTDPGTHGGTWKLSKEILDQQFDPEVVKRLPRGVSIKESDSTTGMHPDEAAELLGFENGAALIQALSSAEKKADLVERLTNEYMKQAFPDLIDNPEGVKKQALAALHNEPRSKLLRMELEYLASNELPALKDVIKKSVMRVPPEGAVKTQAQTLIASTNVGEVKPFLYLRAERASAKAAAVALAKGDIEGAFKSKRQELLNHELYKAALEATELVEKTIDKSERFFGPDEKMAKSRDMDLINAGRAILSLFGLGSPVKDAQSYIEPIKQYDPAMYETIYSLALAATQGRGNYKSVSFDDFQEMAHTLQAIWDLSKSNKQMEIDGVKRNRDELQQELQGRLLELSGPGARAGYDKAATTWDKVKMGLLGVRAALTRVESWVDAMDGGNPKGAFRSYIWQPVSEAIDKYRADKARVLSKYLNEVLKPIEKGLTAEKIDARELGYVFSGKAELLAAMLHIGNESNLQKLLLGRQWGQLNEDGTLNRQRWDGFQARMISEGKLTKADFDFVQGVWDLLEELKPTAQKAHKSMYGYYFNEITANEFTTPFGVYRGGYMPAVADQFMNQDAALRQQREQLESSANQKMFPTTGRGFTKSRVSQYNAPLSLNLALVPGHIDKVLRFSHIEPRVKEVGRLTMDRSFQTALNDFDPAVSEDMLTPWLERSAKQQLSTPSTGKSGRALDYFAKTLRRRTGLQAMVGNVVNSLQQFTGFTLASTKVEWKHLRSGFVSYMSSPTKAAADITEKSVFMKNKLDGQLHKIQQVIDDLTLNPSKFDKVRDFAARHGYFFQQAAQNVIDISVWSGAYDQAVSRGATEIEAVREADAVIRQTQDAQTPESVSRIETGTPFVRLFTQYYSYFNMNANLLGAEGTKVFREMGLKKGATRLGYLYAMGFMIPAVVAEAIVRGMSGKGLDDDDDGQYLDDLLAIFFGSQFRVATAMFPAVGPVANSAINRFNKLPYDDRMSTSPALSAIESTVAGVTFQEKGNKQIRDTLTALSIFTGVPVAPLAKPISYLNDHSSGKARPSGPIDFTRGLITGKPGSTN